MKKNLHGILAHVLIVVSTFLSIHQVCAQQLIGTFTNIDAGFENQPNGSVSSTVSDLRWASNNSGNGQTRTVVSTGGYGGPKYFNIGKTATATTNTTTTGISNSLINSSFTVGTVYIVQFHYKYTNISPNNASPAPPASSSTVFISADGTSGNRYSTNIAIPMQTAWTKAAFNDTATFNITPTVNGNAGIVIRTPVAGTQVLVDIDNFVVYPADNQLAAAADITAPSLPTAAGAVVNSPADATISWNAPVSGVDGGGYVVVRYTTNPSASDDPLQNAVYNVGNTVSTSGTVAYIGKGTSFTDIGLVGSTNYFYRIFTVDKAFNYSTAATTQLTTTAFSNYYYKGTGAITTESNWGINTDGSGTPPPNFTSGGQNFFVRNTTTVTLPNTWAITGSSSKVIIGDASQPAITVTVPEGFPINGKVDIAAPSSGKNTLILNDSIVPAFGSVNVNSIIQFGSSKNQKIQKGTSFVGLTYGDIIIANTNNAMVNVLDSIVVNNLVVNAGSILNCNNLTGASTFNLVVLNGGTVTINGTLQTGKTGGLTGSTGVIVFAGASNLILGNNSIIDYNKDASTTVQIITARQYNNLRISGTSPKAFEGGQILVSGNLTNTCTYVATTCTTCFGPTSMVFNGTGTQTIDSLPHPIKSYADVEFTGGGTKLLTDTITITGTVTLTSGKINLNNRILTLANTSNIAFGTGSALSYFIATNPLSKLIKNGIGFSSTYTMHVGSAANYLPVTLTPQASSGSFEAFVFEGATIDGTIGAPAPSVSIKNNLVDAVWTVNRLAGSGDVDVLFNWPSSLEGAGFSALANTDFSAQRYDGTSWISGTATSNSNAGNTAQASFNSFSPFIVNKNNNPLPITGLSIKAVKQGNNIIVQWSTISEINVRSFIVEKSINGINFSEIGSVNATNNITGSSYFFTDNQPFIGNVYYRIKAVDIDGRFTYSAVVILKADAKGGLVLFNNPVRDRSLNLLINNRPAGKYAIQFLDLSGRVMMHQSLDITGSQTAINIPLPNTISKGVYMIVINGLGLKMVQKVLID